MNRFEYISAKLGSDESFVCKDESVKLFDGNNKVCLLNSIFDFRLINNKIYF